MHDAEQAAVQAGPRSVLSPQHTYGTSTTHLAPWGSQAAAPVDPRSMLHTDSVSDMPATEPTHIPIGCSSASCIVIEGPNRQAIQQPCRGVTMSHVCPLQQHHNLNGATLPAAAGPGGWQREAEPWDCGHLCAGAAQVQPWRPCSATCAVLRYHEPAGSRCVMGSAPLLWRD